MSKEIYVHIKHKVVSQNNRWYIVNRRELSFTICLREEDIDRFLFPTNLIKIKIS